MEKSYSIAHARDNLAAIVHDVEETSTVELTRRGRPVAVLISVAEYERLRGGRRDFWDAYTEFRDGVDLEALGIGPEVFEGLRDPSPGREASWKA